MNHSTIEEKALELLRSLQSERRSLDENPAEILVPRPEDYTQVFIPEVLTIAREGYKWIWQTFPYPEAKLNQTNILVAAATTEEIASNQGKGSLFPGGYHKIVQYLKPGNFWLSWKYTEPGETIGMSYDGLVWMGEERFIWFPKPWKVLLQN